LWAKKIFKTILLHNKGDVACYFFGAETSQQACLKKGGIIGRSGQKTIEFIFILYDCIIFFVWSAGLTTNAGAAHLHQAVPLCMSVSNLLAVSELGAGVY